MTIPANETTLFALMGVQLGVFDAADIRDVVAHASSPSDLADQLDEQGLLDGSQRKAIDNIVNAYLAQHNGDASAAIEALLQTAPELQPLLEAEDESDTTSGTPLSESIAETTSAPSISTKETRHEGRPRRFRILRFHDEGGLGQVFEAEDQELQRTVAVKEIQVKFAADSSSRHRFEREARITGALEHPGIVPVYGLGYYDDGRPYYAMRMIHGRSMREAIREFHALPKNRRNEGERVLAQRRLLGQFLDVCNAIGYAHQRGVMHRDIKPGNIMLGKYGETLVVDWGLAKRSDAAPKPQHEVAEQPVKNISDEEALHTMVGHVVGSPLYMSPEQARGEVEGLGPATDIYSLGATLYTILTDQSAVEGDSKQQVLENVRVGKKRTARAANPDAARALGAICDKAMQFRPKDRYATVAELAHDIERYLGDEPVSAYRENALESAWRFVRKHRNLVMATVAASIVIAVSASAAVLVRQSQREKALAQREEELAVAEQRTMVNFVGQLYTAVPNQAGKSGLFVDYLSRVDKLLGPRYLNPDADNYNPNAHAALTWFLGSAYMPMGMYGEAVTFLEKHLPIVVEQVGETKDTTLVMDKLANSYVQIGKPKQAIPIFENIIRIRKQLGVTRRETIRTYDNLARAHAAVGDYATAIELRQQVLDWSRTLEPVDEKRIASALHNLGLTYLADGSSDKALELLQEADQLRSRILSVANTKTISSRQGIAAALLDQGKSDQARQRIEEIYETCREKYGADHRATWRVFEDRCRIKLAIGEIESLIDDAEKLVAARQHAYETGHPQLFAAQLILAEANFAAGNEAEAVTMLASAASLTEHRYRVDAQAALGELYLRHGDFEAAGESLDKALAEFPEYYSASHKLYQQLLTAAVKAKKSEQ